MALPILIENFALLDRSTFRGMLSCCSLRWCCTQCCATAHSTPVALKFMCGANRMQQTRSSIAEDQGVFAQHRQVRLFEGTQQQKLVRHLPSSAFASQQP
jgi:hypothetical protein